jgi:RND family efflux transporter MFP subunit
MSRLSPVLRATGAVALVASLIAGAVVFVPGATVPARAQQAAPPAPPPAKIRAMVAEERLMAPHLDVPGTVRSRQDAKIAAEVSGRIVWIAEAGTRLKSGDPVARIDNHELRLRAQELDAQITSLKSQLDYQSREAARQEKLAASASATLSRLEESQSRRDVLAQDLSRTRIQRERVGLDLERTTVRAPFDGQIASRMIETGEYSAPGADIVRLVAVDDVEVRAQVPVSLASRLAEGMEVQLNGDGGTAVGRITRLIAIGEAQSRTFEVRVSLPVGTWVVGQAMRVAVPSGDSHPAVAVHRDALVLRGNGVFLFRVTAENKVERLNVTTGAAAGTWIEVLGDLKPGDAVVVRGAERLREGQAVDRDPKIS